MFWQFEEELKGPVGLFIKGEGMGKGEIAMVAEYLASWASYSMRMPNDSRDEILSMARWAETTDRLNEIVQVLLSIGADPL